MTCLTCVAGSPFLAEGTEHSYTGEMFINSGTMDLAASAAALGLRFRVRMQVMSARLVL